MKRKHESPTDPRDALISVGKLLEVKQVQDWIAAYSRPVVLDAVRTTLGELRDQIAKGASPPDTEQVLARAAQHLENEEFQRLRPVINSTGVVLHTNLGRAVLPQAAVDALANLNGCCNLQIDLETGARGKRNYMTERLLCRLTGAEAAMVVNNNAAATLLVLAVLCAGKEVIISRGQLIEIGGSFRLPDCIAQSGAKMVEVGTTNKTHLRDYEAALTERTGAILRCNPSNYRMVGFTKSVSTGELVGLKQRQPVIIIDDLGCGALLDLHEFGLPKEPTVPESVAAGADLVLFSGDKLIGGPQAGIIVGKKDLVARIKKHPLTRMLRVDKMTDLALEHTLRLFLRPETLRETNPTIGMLTARPAELRAKAQAIVEKTGGTGAGIRVRECESAVGGGSLPGVTLPSFAVALRFPDRSADEIAAALRRDEPPVIARIEDDEVLLDVRTLLPGEGEAVAGAIAKLVHAHAGASATKV